MYFSCIGSDVWIAAGCIKQDVAIGDGAVVGTSAIILEYRFDKDAINRIYQSKYWDYSP